jgi:hypothetical protein
MRVHSHQRYTGGSRVGVQAMENEVLNAAI